MAVGFDAPHFHCVRSCSSEPKKELLLVWNDTFDMVTKEVHKNSWHLSIVWVLNVCFPVARPPLSKDDLLRICCWCGQRRLMVVVSWRFSEIWRAHSFSRWWRSFPHFHKPGHLINLFGWGLHPGYKVVLGRVWHGGADNNMVQYKILTNPSPILLQKQLCPWWYLGRYQSEQIVGWKAVS